MSYDKNTWKRKDRITKEKLNHIEEGIYEAHDKINAINNKVEDNTTDTNEARQDISDIKLQIGTEELTTTSKKIKGAINNLNSQINDIVNNNVINAKSYGFNNDGKTLNDDIMKKFINDDSDKVLYFPQGTYLFSSSINFPNNIYLKCDNNAELKLSCKCPLDYFITIRKDSTASDYAINSFITGGTINVNNCAKTGIGLYKTRHMIIENCVIYDPIQYGIKTRTNDIPDGSCRVNNVLIENEVGKKGSVGIFDNGFDNVFDNVEVVNFETACYTIAGRFNNFNAWIRDSSILENSLFAKVDGYDISFSNIAVDTYRKGFFITTQSYSTLINNMLWITNHGVYTDELKSQYPRCIFNADYPDRIFEVSGLKINDESNLSFSNIDLKAGNSSFLNVRVPQNVNGFKTFPNFRNDNYKLQNLAGLTNEPTELTLNKSSDFNNIRKIGLYFTNLWEGDGSNNAPDFQDLGILEVMSTNNEGNELIIQKFYGIYRFAYRVWCSNSWQNWNVVNYQTLNQSI